MLNLTDDTKAVLLLCGVLERNGALPPLAPPEYNMLMHWLVSAGQRPAHLLRPENVPDAAHSAGLEPERLRMLLERGVHLAFAVEEWQRSGIWMLSRSDADYPLRLKKSLKEQAPPLLFGTGSRHLLRDGGLAVLGTSTVEAEEDAFLQDVAVHCAQSGLPVLSGGARGVEQTALRHALEQGGRGIGIAPGALLQRSLERPCRQAIADGNLLLLSPHHPDTAGAAPDGGPCLHALAAYTLVVNTEKSKGKVWDAAREILRAGKPLFTRDVPGNAKLLQEGALPWPEKNAQEPLLHLLERLAGHTPPHTHHPQSSGSASLLDAAAPDQQRAAPGTPAQTAPAEPHAAPPSLAEQLYTAVLPVLLAALEAPLTPEDVAARLEVLPAQAEHWLHRAVEQGHLRRLTAPVRFVRV